MLHLCVCAHCCCLTGVNYALIRHAFFCSIYIALLGQHRRQIDECRQWCSAVNCYVVQRLVPILASRNAIGDTHKHTITRMHAYKCTRRKRTNHNEIEKGVIPIPNIVDAVLIVVHNLQHFFSHLLNRIALNGMESRRLSVVCFYIIAAAQIITLFVPGFRNHSSSLPFLAPFRANFGAVH